MTRKNNLRPLSGIFQELQRRLHISPSPHLFSSLTESSSIHAQEAESKKRNTSETSSSGRHRNVPLSRQSFRPTWNFAAPSTRPPTHPFFESSGEPRKPHRDLETQHQWRTDQRDSRRPSLDLGHADAPDRRPPPFTARSHPQVWVEWLYRVSRRESDWVPHPTDPLPAALDAKQACMALVALGSTLQRRAGEEPVCRLSLGEEGGGGES